MKENTTKVAAQDMDYNPLMIGDKIEYMGDYDDDNDLFEAMEDNDCFNLTINQIDEEAELCWTDEVDFAIQLALVRKLV